VNGGAALLDIAALKHGLDDVGPRGSGADPAFLVSRGAS
jgi:hypothetical protein